MASIVDCSRNSDRSCLWQGSGIFVGCKWYIQPYGIGCGSLWDTISTPSVKGSRTPETLANCFMNNNHTLKELDILQRHACSRAKITLFPEECCNVIVQ